MEWECYVCYGVISPNDLFVDCDYCSWTKHRKCSDWSLEDYYYMNRSGTHIQRACESCEDDFGEEAREINKETFEKKRNDGAVEKPTLIPSTSTQVVASCLNSAQSFYLDPRLERESLDRIDPEILRKMAEEEERPVEYTIIENGTKRGGKLLKGSDGHSYTLKKVTSRTTSWRCRNRDTDCGATVIQRGDTFKRGRHEHKHFGRTNYDKKTRKVTAKARSGYSMTARQIVQSVLDQHKGETSFITPNFISNLIRTVNRTRQGLRKQQTS